MKHQMKLRAEPFDQIRSGKKTIELRLWDEKRQQIREGDEIAFSCADAERCPFTVRVKALHVYESFAELYDTLPLTKCGYRREDLASARPEDMEAYYPPERQAQYGVVGIEVRREERDDPLTRASRFLSLVLRHRPSAAGITVDRHGWADVDALLAGMRAKHPITMAQLEEIVRTDNKQRYSFSDDKTRIRANQGHSIPVDVELAEREPPEVLYHGTGEKYLQSILSQGLKPGKRLFVHLTEDLETAKLVGLRHGEPVVLRLDTAAMRRDGMRFFLSDNHVWLTHYVSPGYLEVYKGGTK